MSGHLPTDAALAGLRLAPARGTYPPGCTSRTPDPAW